MYSQIHCIVILTSFSLTSSKGVIDKLPLCPTYIQYFPQNLPMHCRMPRSADFHELAPPQNSPQVPPNLIPSEKESNPNQMQGLFPPGPFPMPVGPIPGGPFPVAMPMMPMSGPSHKLPVIVMPFYSPDPSYKKQSDAREPGIKHRRPQSPRKKYRRPRRHPDDSKTDSETDDSNESVESFDSGSKEGWWNDKKQKRKETRKRNGYRKSGRRHSSNFKRRHKKSRELLTPVLQYVTKDGYVIFEKQISKGEAKDWLNVNKENEHNENASQDKDSKERKGKANSKEHHLIHEEKHKTVENNMSSEKDLDVEETTTEKAYTHKIYNHRHHKPNTLVELSENGNIKDS